MKTKPILPAVRACLIAAALAAPAAGQASTESDALFGKSDGDHNGALDQNELTGALTTLGIGPNPQITSSFMAENDQNHNGTLDSAEFGNLYAVTTGQSVGVLK